ncbi:isochorismatase family cysteine hydrolase [Virgibacillus sediminis]|uniref:Isochorismatase family cysteine hydrolase n=1 Tax=Virgibacillus sediminis TaxID=202260 RepID=A0ABV7A6S8_9BACI
MDQSFSNTAVLFVDVINNFDFDGGEDLLANTNEILQHMKDLRDFAKKNDLPTIYVNDHYGLWQADFNKIIDYCKHEGNKHIIDTLKPDDNDYFMIKPQHSAFFQTPLQSLLNELECQHLIVSGFAGDICILFTAKDAYMYGFDMRVPQNCMASEKKEGNDYALYLMRTVMKTDITPF